MSSAFSFAAPLCLWALPYFMAYVVVRAISQWSLRAVRWFGWLSVAIWSLLFFFIAYFVIGRERASYAASLDLSMAATHLFTLGLGGSLMRVISNKKWSWKDAMLFSAFYFVVTHGSMLAYSVRHPGIVTAMDNYIRSNTAFLGVPSNNPILFYSGILALWFFPMGAPLVEIVIRSFWRLRQGNKTGAFA